jgi:hypothetical protein
VIIAEIFDIDYVQISQHKPSLHPSTKREKNTVNWFGSLPSPGPAQLDCTPQQLLRSTAKVWGCNPYFIIRTVLSYEIPAGGLINNIPK